MLGNIYLKELIHVFGHVQHDRLTDALSSETRAATAWKNRNVAFCCDLHSLDDILTIFRNDNTYRLYLVEARVCAVECFRIQIEADLSRKRIR